MYWLLLILGVINAVAGLLNLSSVTLGLGLLASGCFLAIVARVVQAEVHERGWGRGTVPALLARR